VVDHEEGMLLNLPRPRIEVKRCATKLTTKHLRQVEMYAVNEGVEWLILTNGSNWQVYHVTGGLPVVIDLAFDVSILGDMSPAEKAGQLFYISLESFKRRQIDELWKAKRMSPTVVDSIRKELRRTTGQNIASSEITRLLRETVIRPECSP
jgi:predicted type IV restriction endonuclease